MNDEKTYSIIIKTDREKTIWVGNADSAHIKKKYVKISGENTDIVFDISI